MNWRKKMKDKYITLTHEMIRRKDLTMQKRT
jgi:hypothetical protein